MRSTSTKRMATAVVVAAGAEAGPAAMHGGPQPGLSDPVCLAGAMFARFRGALCLLQAVDERTVCAQLARRGEIPEDPHWLLASRVRQRAAWLTCKVAGFRQAALAKAIGLTRPAITIACRMIEEQRRHDPAVEKLLDEAARQVLGGTDHRPLQNVLKRAATSSIGGAHGV